MSDSLREDIQKHIDMNTFKKNEDGSVEIDAAGLLLTLSEALSAPQADAAYTMDQIVSLTYTNYRGETAQRHIVPKSLRFGSTEWHPEPQWLLLAWDADKRADREFALKDFGSAAPQADAEPFYYRHAHPDHDPQFSRQRLTDHDKARGWEETPLYTAPPSQSAVMRRAHSALQTFAAECHRSKWHFDLNEENPPNVYDSRRLVRKAFDELQRIGNIAMHERDELKALSRADDGKESEGSPVRDCSETSRPNCEPERSPSDPTPPDREAWPNGCRNPNSCSIHRDCMYVGCTNYDRDISVEVDAALLRGGA